MSRGQEDAGQYVHTVSVVVPVYGGEHTLPAMVGELAGMRGRRRTPDGNVYELSQVLLVWDHGRDHSDDVIRGLEKQYDFVEGVWLSRNFGQHPATIAGMSRSTGDWVVTMDEDGQHDPAYVADMLDTAMRERADVVYADPTNAAPHSWFRNVTSWGAKFVAKHLMGAPNAPKYQSYRLVLGSVARALSQSAGVDAYLDVALGWFSNRIATCPVALREEGDHTSSYNLARLLGHFWRMIVTGGTRPLRFVSVFGAFTAFVGIIWAIVLVFLQLFGQAVKVQGWTSLMVVILVFSGLILLSIGVVAEYIGINVRRSMGMPLYLIGEDEQKGPLGQRDKRA